MAVINRKSVQFVLLLVPSSMLRRWSGLVNGLPMLAGKAQLHHYASTVTGTAVVMQGVACCLEHCCNTKESGFESGDQHTLLSDKAEPLVSTNERNTYSNIFNSQKI